MNRLVILFCAFFNVLLIGYFWFQNNSASLLAGGPSLLLSLSRLSGLYLVFVILVQFLIMGRSLWLERAFGLDKLSRIHRLNGYFVVAFLLLHPVLLIAGYSMLTGISFIDQAVQVITEFEYVFPAFIGVLLLLLVIVSSVYIVRNRVLYEWWYAVHLFTYSAVVLAFFHQQKIGEDFLAHPGFNTYWTVLYIFVFGNVLLFRFIRPLFLYYRHSFKVSSNVQESHNVRSISIKGKKIGDLKIKPGQFITVRFLDQKLWWEAHPFSISQIPSGNQLRITPKQVGDYTSRLSHVTEKTPVILEGPFGTFTSDRSRNNKVLLIAGGIGITPIRTLLEQFVKEKRDIVLVYSVQTEKDLVFEKEIKQLQKLHSFVYRPFVSRSENHKHYGKISARALKDVIPDVTRRDVFLCGPLPFMKSVESYLHSLNVPKRTIFYEEFTW